MKKYAKLNNGVLEFPPVNKGQIINYNLNEEMLVKDGYKEFIKGETEINKSYTFSYMETQNQIIEIVNEVVIDNNEILKNANREKIEEIKLKLQEIDFKSIRPLRAGEIDKINELEEEAGKLREELRKLMESN